MVEQTTIMNIILNVMKKVNDIPFLWESIWTEKALKPLLSSFFNQIKEFKDWNEVEENILFLTDMAKELISTKIKE